MPSLPRGFSSIALLGFLLLFGCEQAAKRKWEIVAENQSNAPCTVSVDLGGGTFNDARVNDLPQGKRWVLLSAVPKVVIRSVKVVCRQQEQEIKPDVELPVGKQYLIQVAVDGRVSASIVDQ